MFSITACNYLDINFGNVKRVVPWQKFLENYQPAIFQTLTETQGFSEHSWHALGRSAGQVRVEDRHP